MAYNKISNQSFFLDSNVSGSNLLVSGSKLLFTNNFLISETIDKNLQNAINNVQIKNDSLLLSGSLILQSGSVLTDISLLNSGSQLIFSKSEGGSAVSYLGLTDLLTDENIILKNTSGSIIVSGNINVKNNTYFNQQVSGSLIYLDETEQNKLLKVNAGGINIDVQTDAETQDKYFEISLGVSSSGNNVNAFTALNTFMNITCLSNKKEYCKNKNGLNYDLNKDILFLKGNAYPQFSWNNTLATNNATNLTSILGNIWSTNSNNGLNSSSRSKYKNIPQCIILRPGNDKDNLDTYFSGDSHYIKIKNDDIPYPGENNPNNENVSSLFILDLTHPEYISNLQRGFKWEILIDNFKNSVFNIKTDETFAMLPGSFFNNLEAAQVNISNFLYANYIPYEYSANSTNIEIHYPLGNSFLNSSANPALVPITLATGATYPNLTKYANGLEYSGFLDSPANTIPYKYIIAPYSNIGAGTLFKDFQLNKSSLNFIHMHSYTLNLGVNLLTPSNPVKGDFFWIQILQDTTDLTRYQIQIKNSLKTLNFYDLFYKKVTNIANTYRLKFKKYNINNQALSYEYSIDINTPSVRPSDCTFRFEYDGNEWISNDYILDSTTNKLIVNNQKALFYQDFAFDYGGLQYPTLFAVEMPSGHSIVDFSNTKQVGWNGHNVFTHKNNNDFYLWGDKTKFETWQGNLTNPTQWLLNGGWLRSLELNNQQDEKKENNTSPGWFFKKIYKNFYLIVANTSINKNIGFNWPNSFSNFQLVYIGNGEWIIT